MIISKIRRFRQTKLWLTTINLIIIIVALNLIVNLIPINFDLTSNKIHSLAPATKEILGQVDDLVTIKAFVSSNIPPQLIPLKETLENLLDQYQRAGHGKIKVIWLDPQKDEKAKNEALSLGIRPIQFSSLQKDQFQVVQGYFGLAVFFAGEKQVIPALQEISNLEYQITATINRLGQKELPKIGFGTGVEELTSDRLKKVRQLLELSYQIESVDLSQDGAKFDPEIKALIVIGPKAKFSQAAKLIIDQYLMRQKGVLLLLDPVSVAEGLVAKQIDNDLDQFLNHFGIKVNQVLVVDPSSAFANFRTEYGNFIIPYPLWVKVRRENIARDLPPTASLESAVLPWVASLELSQGAKPLLQSTPQATTIKSFANLAPTRDWNAINQERKQQVLAALQTNKTTSFFKEEPDQVDELVKKVGLDQLIKETKTVKLAVVADSDLVEDQTINSYPENVQFFLNLVDYLSQDTKLISIRSKTVFSRPLKIISDQEKQTIKIINLASGPLVLALLGLSVRWRRKRQKLS